VYSPVAFGKKTDPNGDYIRKYVPQLSKYPKQYIFEPWKAPAALQKSCGCIIGKDYPSPIVDHDRASKANMAKMNVAYSANKQKDTMPHVSKSPRASEGGSVGTNDTAGEEEHEPKRKRIKAATGKRQ